MYSHSHSSTATPFLSLVLFCVCEKSALVLCTVVALYYSLVLSRYSPSSFWGKFTTRLFWLTALLQRRNTQNSISWRTLRKMNENDKKRETLTCFWADLAASSPGPGWTWRWWPGGWVDWPARSWQCRSSHCTSRHRKDDSGVFAYTSGEAELGDQLRHNKFWANF